MCRCAEGRCADCHRPHSSNYKPLLAETMEKLCFQCHTELGEEVGAAQFRHGPVKTGACTACHNMVHGSTFVKLLGRQSPMNFSDAYSQTKYDLCFGCHNKDIAKKQTTTELTNFRDGEYNLHFLHVNRKKGRTCTACHGAHASSQAKHIRDVTGVDGRYRLPVPVLGTYFLVARTGYGGSPVPGDLFGRFEGTADHSVAVRAGDVLTIDITVGEVR